MIVGFDFRRQQHTLTPPLHAHTHLPSTHTHLLYNSRHQEGLAYNGAGEIRAFHLVNRKHRPPTTCLNRSPLKQPLDLKKQSPNKHNDTTTASLVELHAPKEVACLTETITKHTHNGTTTASLVELHAPIEVTCLIKAISTTYIIKE